MASGMQIGTAFVSITADSSEAQSEISGMGGSLSPLAAVAGAAVGAALIAGIIGAMGNDQVLANVTAQFGLTEKESQIAGKSAGSLYRQNFGESMEQVAPIIAQVGDSLGGLTDSTRAETEKISGHVLTMADVFGVDAATSVAALDSAVKNGLAPSLQNATDIATRVFQEAGPKGEEFLDVINEYGPNLQALGISMEDFGAMSVGFLDGGGLSIDQFADSLREMSIKVLDGSAEASGAFDAIGLDAGAMTAAIAAGGPEANAAFDQMVAGLLAIKDPVAQNAAGAALFGSMWEDSSGAILAGLAPVPGALGEVDGAAQSMSDTVGGTASSNIESFKRTAMGLATDVIGGAILPALGNFASTLSSTLGPAITSVTGFIQDNKTVLGTVASVIGGIVAAFALYKGAMLVATAVTTGYTAVQTALNVVMAMNPIALIVLAIAGLVAGFIYLWNNVEGFRNFWVMVWDAIMIAVDAVVLWFTDTVVPAFEAAWAAVQVGLQAIGDFFSAIWNGIKSAIEIAILIITTIITTYINIWKAIITTVFNVIVAIVTGVWNAIVAVISGAVNAVSAVVSAVFNAVSATVSAVFNGIKSVASSVWNGIVSVVSGAVAGVKAGINGLSTIPATVSGWFTSMATGVSTAFTGVVTFVTGIPGKVVSALGSVGSTLKNAGGQLISGFIDGIKAKFESVKSSLGDLTSKLTSWKGPESLDKVILKDAGQMVIGGFINGLESQYGNVKKSLTGLTNMVAGTDMPGISSTVTGPSGSLSGLSGGGSGTLQQTNYITIDASSVKDFNTVVEIFNGLEQTARAGRGTSNLR